MEAPAMRLREPGTGCGEKVRPAERITWIASCVVFVVICLGCMSIGGRTEYVTHDDHSSTQSGQATLRGGQELEVYYPAPYAHPPNLELEKGAEDSAVVVEQKADHFRVKNTGLWSRTVSWKARGVPTSSASPPAEVPVSSPKAIVTTSS
jgi:hypothetical protein